MAAKRPKIKPYEGEDGQWYWRLIAKNGQTVMIGGQGFDSRWNAKRAAKRIIDIAAEAEYVED